MYAGIDIGGTNQTVALADEEGVVLGVRRQKTAAGAAAPDLVAGIEQALDSLVREHAVSLRGVGVGFGGPVDSARGVILTSHHVPAWANFPLGETLSTRLGVPVTLDNDANAGALGEARFGAGRGHRNLLYINIGTGIGAGVVLNGALFRGASGLAGEIGHVTVDASSEARECPCGKRGCLEAYASGRSIGRRAGTAGRQVTEAAAAGEAQALAVLREAAAYLGLAIGNAANVLNPSAVVIGGGVADAGDLLLDPVRREMARHLMPGMPPPEVLRAALGYDAGVIGAAALAVDACERA